MNLRRRLRLVSWHRTKVARSCRDCAGWPSATRPSTARRDSWELETISRERLVGTLKEALARRDALCGDALEAAVPDEDTSQTVLRIHDRDRSISMTEGHM